MTTTAAHQWNAMNVADRHEWLISARISNYSLRYLDWEDLPAGVRQLLTERKP